MVGVGRVQEKHSSHKQLERKSGNTDKDLNRKGRKVSILLGLYKQGSAESETLELSIWQCSGGKEG